MRASVSCAARMRCVNPRDGSFVMLTKRLFLVLLAMAPAAVIARGSTLPTITVSDPLAVTSGSSLDATVAVRDLLPTLGAFDITIGFDPAFLTATDVTFFGMLGDPAA